MRSGDSRFLDKPGHLIRRLQQISFALFMEQASEFGVTPVQYAALIAIGNHPGIDQTTLCNIIAFDRSTIGGVVGRLEKKKLITRRSGAADRRTKSLYITAAGRGLLRRIEPVAQLAQRLILGPLKPGERGAFMAMLRRLVHINNEYSRAPLRGQDMPRRRAGAARDTGRKRAPLRPAADALAD